jgi:hypothetical protein
MKCALFLHHSDFLTVFLSPLQSIMNQLKQSMAFTPEALEIEKQSR